MKDSLENETNQRSFVVEGEEKLRNMMAAHLDNWRIFLHPTQKKLVIKDFADSARVLGGTGTRKTVDAIHRTK